MSGITRTQADCLAAIRRLTTSDGVPPSYEELRVAMGLASRSGIFRILTLMRDRGLIDWQPGTRRSISVLTKGPNKAELALLPTDALYRIMADLRAILAERPDQ